MKKGNVIIAVLLFVFGSVNTYARTAQPKPGRNPTESITNMTELVCQEVTPLVADSLEEAYKGKNPSQVAKYLVGRATQDEKEGEKYYPTILDPKKWGKATAGTVSKHAAKIQKDYPNDPKTYAASVERTKTTFYETCLKEYQVVMKEVYDQQAKAK